MIIPFLKGLATTLRMVFTKPITQQYPEEKREMYPRWRGHPQLTIDPDGRRRCVACTLCMVVCPSNAIRAINPERVSPVARARASNRCRTQRGNQPRLV